MEAREKESGRLDAYFMVTKDELDVKRHDVKLVKCGFADALAACGCRIEGSWHMGKSLSHLYEWATFTIVTTVELALALDGRSRMYMNAPLAMSRI